MTTRDYITYFTIIPCSNTKERKKERKEKYRIYAENEDTANVKKEKDSCKQFNHNTPSQLRCIVKDRVRTYMQELYKKQKETDKFTYGSH